MASAAQLSAGLRAAPFWRAAPEKQYIGRPPGTARDATAEDPAGTRAPLAKIGDHSVDGIMRLCSRWLFSGNQFFIT